MNSFSVSKRMKFASRPDWREPARWARPASAAGALLIQRVMSSSVGIANPIRGAAACRPTISASLESRSFSESTALRSGACSNVFTTGNATFYARAEVKGDSDQYWGSDIKQCVEYPGPYDFYTRSEDTTCPEGEPQEFTTFHSDGRPVYVWNLNP